MSYSEKILILEDEAAHAEAIRRSLISSGRNYEIHIAYTLHEYHELVSGVNPSIVLSDMNLPDGNALDILVESPEERPFPIIVMTSYGDEAIAVHAIKAGALDYVVKSENAFIEMPRIIERSLREWQNLMKRKNAEEALRNSEARYRILAENMSDMVWLMNIDFKTLYISPSVTKTRGYEMAELNEISMENHMTQESWKRLSETFSHMLSRGNLESESPLLSFAIDIELNKKNGCPFWCENVFTIILDEAGKPTNILAAGRDITERKWAETVLYQQNMELKAAKEKAEESDRLKSAFLANVSHEIRTPMNGILGFAEFLRNPLLSQEKREQYIDIINSSSKQLLGIITDIIDISKIETKLVKIIKGKTNINDIINNVYSNLLMTIPKGKNVHLRVNKTLQDSLCMVNTDEVKLQQIISNLVENAIKFTDEGTVEFGYSVDEPNHVTFHVKDTGIGIDKGFHTVIFDRFRRVEMTQNVLRGGTGLGLAISKAYVELLGGNIWLESETGRGSTFSFKIPLEFITEQNNKEANSEITQVSFDQMNILIAEDDDINFLYLYEIISQASATILRAQNGRQLLEILESNPSIDLILMDIKMPIMNGIEATVEIRKTNQTIPIIAQTAYAFEEERQRALSAGCNDYLSKPIKKALLISYINKYKKLYK